VASSRQRLRRRTPTVVVLDMVLGVFGTVRRVRSTRRRRSPDAGGRPVAVGLAAAVAAALVLTAIPVAAVLRAPEGLMPLRSAPGHAVAQPPDGAGPATQLGGSPRESGSVSSPATATSSRAAGERTPGTTEPPARPEAPAGLTARYARRDDGGSLFGYRASVTIDNPGGVPVAGWTMTITLPRRTLTISDVTGASVDQDGAVWTFLPAPGTATVPPRRSVLVTFQVNGAAVVAADPTACTVDGRSCDGLAG
jgi:hypothetical protein